MPSDEVEMMCFNPSMSETTPSMGTVTSSITFSAEAHHIERFSDSEDLEYERDIFLALLTYRHEF